MGPKRILSSTRQDIDFMSQAKKRISGKNWIAKKTPLRTETKPRLKNERGCATTSGSPVVVNRSDDQTHERKLYGACDHPFDGELIGNDVNDVFAQRVRHHGEEGSGDSVADALREPRFRFEASLINIRKRRSEEELTNGHNPEAVHDAVCTAMAR